MVDDLLLQASSEEQMFRILDVVVQRARRYGATLHPKKLVMGKELTFAGFLIKSTEEGP